MVRQQRDSSRQHRGESMGHNNWGFLKLQVIAMIVGICVCKVRLVDASSDHFLVGDDTGVPVWPSNTNMMMERAVTTHSVIDLNDCASYSTIWLFELASSCDGPNSSNGCQCTTAQSLVNSGVLACEYWDCPKNCPICDQCLDLTCPDSRQQ